MCEPSYKINGRGASSSDSTLLDYAVISNSIKTTILILSPLEHVSAELIYSGGKVNLLYHHHQFSVILCARTFANIPKVCVEKGKLYDVHYS